MPITLGDTTISGLAAGGLPSGVINAANMASSGAWAPSGSIIAVNIIRATGRTAVSNATTGTLFSGTFTKQRADSNILAWSTVFGNGYASGNVGLGLKLGSTHDYGGCQYNYDGSWSQALQTTICNGHGYWTGFAAGTQTISCGWVMYSGSNERPFDYLNNSDACGDGRVQTMTSSIVVYEIAP
jgi:hypothetical protein